MKYQSWLNYPDMSIAVQKTHSEYRCIEYEPSGKKRQNYKSCSSILELKFYLLSLPSPPKKQVLELINALTPTTSSKSKFNQ